MRTKIDKSLSRVLDANFNRAKEGLRVCEDVCRFIFNDQAATREYKKIRHQLNEVLKVFKSPGLIQSRDIGQDVGKGSTQTELKRETVFDIFYANSQRTKESIRVLEEFMKLIDKKSAQKLKSARYQIYALEQTIIKKC